MVGVNILMIMRNDCETAVRACGPPPLLKPTLCNSKFPFTRQSVNSAPLSVTRRLRIMNCLPTVCCFPNVCSIESSSCNAVHTAYLWCFYHRIRKSFSHEAISPFSNYVVIYSVCMGPVQNQPLLPKEQDWLNQWRYWFCLAIYTSDHKGLRTMDIRGVSGHRS